MDQLNLSLEDKLLLYCSRVSMDGEIELKIKEILDKTLDWNYILDCSAKQGVSPLLYWSLSKISDGKAVPYEIIKSLEKRYYANLARNMLFYEELSKVLKAFEKADIDIIVMKGVFLAEKIYKNIGLRQMKDIDLLIREEDLQRAKRELGKLMYFPTKVFPTKLHEQFQIILNNDLPFVNENKNIIIEIHWDIQPPVSNYKVEINEFWKNVKPVKIAGIESLTFSPENILQHLCLHLDKHINMSIATPAEPLRDYCDISEVTRYYKEIINWNYLLKSSKNYEIEKPVFQCLFIANKYFGAFVPDNILRKFESVKLNINFQEIFKGEIKRNSSARNYKCDINLFMNLKHINGTCNRVYILLGEIFPSKDFMINCYSIKNKKEVYMYYLIRLVEAFLWGLDILRQLPRFFLKSFFSK